VDNGKYHFKSTATFDLLRNVAEKKKKKYVCIIERDLVKGLHRSNGKGTSSEGNENEKKRKRKKHIERSFKTDNNFRATRQHEKNQDMRTVGNENEKKRKRKKAHRAVI
jgi:hypothetical protein